MTKPWISDARQRRSQTYLDLHRKLKTETQRPKVQPELPKRERKQAQHMLFRMQAES